MSSIKYDSNLSENFENPPPTYDEVVHSPPITSIIRSSPSASFSTQRLLIPSSFKPIVIPQISSQSRRGAFMSLFTRAYAPVLSSPQSPNTHAITPSQFLHFIDGLNRILISSPAYQATSLVGTFITHVPLPIIPVLGTGIVASAGAASTSACLSRARAYVKMANEELFLERGLRCRILKTRDMMRAVGCGGEVLALPTLKMDILVGSGIDKGLMLDDPKMRRIRALGNRVAELEFDGLPGPGDVEGWWQRLGVKEAHKKDEKMRKVLMQSREKGFEKMLEKSRKKEEEEARYQMQIGNLQREKMRMEMMLTENDSDSLAMMEVEKNIQRELQKLDKEVSRVLNTKERKISEIKWEEEKEMRDAVRQEEDMAQKLFWIVIDKGEQL